MPRSSLMTAADILAMLMTVTDIDRSPRTPCAEDIRPPGSFLMRVFVTGASGWIGSAVVPELIDAGHQVTGLARSDASAAALAAAGAQVHRGTLDDLESMRSAAAASDGVIHLAFKHDLAFSGDFQGAADADRRAVETLGEALAGTDQPFVLASGLLGIAPGRVATEQDGHDLDPAVAAFGEGPQTRQATAQLVLSLASQGVRSSVMRLSADKSRRWRQRLHGVPGRDRPREGRLRLHRRRDQPLACRA